MAAESTLRQSIDFRRQDKIILMQPTNSMRPVFDPDFVPVDMEIRMVPFGLGDIPHLVNKGDRVSKILERE